MLLRYKLFMHSLFLSSLSLNNYTHLPYPFSIQETV